MKPHHPHLAQTRVLVQPCIHQHSCKSSWCQAWQSCWCPLHVSPQRWTLSSWSACSREEERSQWAQRSKVLYFHLPEALSVLGNTAVCSFFCFRKMPFTLSPPWYRLHLSQQGRMEKPLGGKSEKLFGQSLWGAEFKGGGVTHLEGDTATVPKGRSKPENSLLPCLVASEILSAALSRYSQSHLGFSLALKATDTCGFQHFPHGKEDTCNELRFFSS